MGDPRHPGAPLLARREMRASAEIHAGADLDAELAIDDVGAVARRGVLEGLLAEGLRKPDGGGVVDALAEGVEEQRGQVLGSHSGE